MATTSDRAQLQIVDDGRPSFADALADYRAKRAAHLEAANAWEAADLAAFLIETQAAHRADLVKQASGLLDHCQELAEPMHEAKDRLLATPAPDVQSFLQKIEILATHSELGGEDASELILREARRFVGEAA